MQPTTRYSKRLALALALAMFSACGSDDEGGGNAGLGGASGETGGAGGTTGGAGGFAGMAITGGAGGETGGIGGVSGEGAMAGVGGIGGAAGTVAGGVGGVGGEGGMAGGAGGMTGGMGGEGGAGGMMPTGPFTLTSTSAMDGGTLPAKHRCVALGGETGPSPDFSWSNPPVGTMSFALLMTDKSNEYAHWTIFDIPAATTSLPEGVMRGAMPSAPAGAKQIANQDANVPGPGYFGPCHPFLANPYEFKLYALDVAALPGVGVDSTRAQVQAAVDMHDLESVAITVMSGP